VDAFRAVLAHEYGHFTNRDTAGGEIALRVNRDM
jgi:Zn-dependent protease with chaperone function